MLSEFIIKSHHLQLLDISNNGIDVKSIYCLSVALQYNKSLKTVVVEGNPIGAVGLGLLMKAKNKNMNDF